MLVTTAQGKTYMVMRDTRIHEDLNARKYDLKCGALVEINGDDFIHINEYGTGLRSTYCQKQYNNIVKVSLPISFGFNKTLEEMGEEIIWQRVDRKDSL
jgi:hypothetical protein